MEQEKTIDDWRANISDSTETLKLKDGESVVGVFANEGLKKTHPDFGTSVAFQFLKEQEKEPKTFFVKANNFSLLAQLKALGTLTGTKVRISRKGSKRSDTRYQVEKI